MEYQPEELLPLWQKLAAKYTSHDSTSVSYEKAQQLMEAILYCVQEWEQNRGEAQTDNLPAAAKIPESLATAYEEGVKLVRKKTEDCRRLYGAVTEDFLDFGCIALRDTVLAGMPSFFLHYDMYFAPQEHLLTLDYPVIGEDRDICGIDLIWEYMRKISLEQDFWHVLPEAYAVRALEHSCPDYRELFENLCVPLIRHAQYCVMAGSRVGDRDFSPQQKRQILEYKKGKTREGLAAELSGMTGMLVHGFCSTALPAERCTELTEYLQQDCVDFAAVLYHAQEEGGTGNGSEY